MPISEEEKIEAWEKASKDFVKATKKYAKIERHLELVYCIYMGKTMSELNAKMLRLHIAMVHWFEEMKNTYCEDLQRVET